MNKVLLLGNGVNRAVDNAFPSWFGLLDELGNTFGIDVIKNDYIPCPITFEQMVNMKSGGVSVSEKVKKMKQELSLILDSDDIKPTDCHHQIANSGYDEILTTNYDYNIERSIIPDFKKQKRKLAANKQEYIHSLKRSYKVGNKLIWHIHGELISSRSYTEKVSINHYPEESILIGYDQYAQYLRVIIDNVKKKSISNDNEIDLSRLNLVDRMNAYYKSGQKSPFWIDRFFTTDLDIAGFTFDFSEIHLWWLLNYRAQLKHNGKIFNSIRFLEPKIVGKKDNERAIGIRKILSCMDVEIQPIRCKSYADYYVKVAELGGSGKSNLSSNRK